MNDKKHFFSNYNVAGIPCWKWKLKNKTNKGKLKYHVHQNAQK